MKTTNTIKDLSVYYHFQLFEHKGERYFLDTYDRKEFELYELTMDTKYHATIVTECDEGLQEGVEEYFQSIL